MSAGQEPVFSSPVTINGFRKRKRRLTFNESGEEVGADNVFVIDREVSNSDYLAQGDQTATSDPRDVSSAVRVISCEVSPNIRGTESRFIAMG